MPLNNTQVLASLRGDYSSALDLGTAVFGTNLSRGTNFDPGTGAGQVDKIFTDTRTIAPSSADPIDLAGVLVDAFGAALTFARIKAVLISAAAANVNNLIVGGVTNGLTTITLPQTTGQVIIRPGGMFVVCCGSGDATGYVVTPATGDILNIANSGAGTSVTYDIAVVGCSV